MKIKLNKLALVLAIGGFCNAFADNFPLAMPQNGSQASNSQQQQPPLSTNNVNNGAVPQLSTSSSPVDSGKILVSNSNSGTSMISSSDQLTADLNNAKKQAALADLNKKLGYSVSKPNNNTDSNTPIVDVPLKPISASMIGYFIVAGGQKSATIQFADLSSQDVQVGSLISGYKVSSISPDTVNLIKYDKKVTGDKNIKIRKSNPVIMSNTGNQGPSFNSGQSLDMDFSKK